MPCTALYCSGGAPRQPGSRCSSTTTHSFLHRLGSSPAMATAAVAVNWTQVHVNGEQIKLLMEGIRNTREGAFVPFTQQPALHALLLPFGSYGGLQVIEYLMNL